MDHLNEYFTPVTMEDLPLLKSFADLGRYEEAEHNIITMIIWQDTYPLYKYVTDDYLLLAGTHDDLTYLYMPMCESEYFEKALLKGKELFMAMKLPLRLTLFTKENKDKALKVLPDLKVIDLKDNYDYVYLREQFASFAGKKMQKKRNHLHQFRKLYDCRYLYEDLKKDNLDEVIAYVKELPVESATLKVEQSGIIRTLKAFEDLNYQGGIIRIDQKIVALIIASKLSDRMVQENVEKVDHTIPGLSQALQAHFFSSHFTDLPYLNREDDMGLEELRKSKLSYHPLFMIEKYDLYAI